MSENNLKELELNELIEYLNNTNINNIDLDALLDVKLLEKVSVDDVSPDLITALMNDDKMLSDDNKAYQIASKTSRGAKILYTLLNGSNHEKIKELLSMKEEALKSGVAVAFSDNITVIENSLEYIKSQVAAISKGIMSEEARYKARFLDPMASKIDEITIELANNEIMESQLDRLTGENEKLVKDVERLNLSNEKNKATIIEQKETINELTAESRELMKANKDFNKTLETAKSEFNKKIDKYLSSIKELEKEKETLTIKLEQAALTESNLREEMKLARTEHVEEVNKINQTSLSVERELNGKILDLNVSINTLQSEKSSLESLNKLLSEENRTLKTSVNDSSSEKKNMESQISLLTLEKKALEVEVKGKDELIESHNQNIKNYLKDIKELNNKLDGEIKLRHEKENKIVQLELQLNDLKDKLGKANGNKSTKATGKESNSKK